MSRPWRTFSLISATSSAAAEDGYLQPVYGIGLESKLIERQVESLKGYRGNQPIRVGNQAYEHDQHDGYGSVLLGGDPGLFRPAPKRQPAGEHTFRRLETIGDKAYALAQCPRRRSLGVSHHRARAYPFQRHVLGDL